MICTSTVNTGDRKERKTNIRENIQWHLNEQSELSTTRRGCHFPLLTLRLSRRSLDLFRGRRSEVILVLDVASFRSVVGVVLVFAIGFDERLFSCTFGSGWHLRLLDCVMWRRKKEEEKQKGGEGRR